MTLSPVTAAHVAFAAADKTRPSRHWRHACPWSDLTTMSLRALERRSWGPQCLLQAVKKGRSHPRKDNYA